MNPPIFVHAWWRSSSTYVWSRLRHDTRLRCYYEPLHECIADLRAEEVATGTHAKRNSALRHPPAERHNFHEYLDLLKSGEMHFTPELAYERYLLAPDADDPALHAHLASLIADAASSGRRATLCFTRSQMRSAWMKHQFGGIHIAQIRNPLDQWASFHVAPYFVHGLVTIALDLRRTCPRAFQHIGSLTALSAQTDDPARPMPLPSISQIDLARIFMLLWQASTLQAVANADFIIDVDLLSSDDAYRKRLVERFADIGCTVDFSDCAAPARALPRDARERALSLAQQSAGALLESASQLLPGHPDGLTDTRIQSVSSATLKYLEPCLARPA
jgi:hypothetical protein